MREKNTKSKFKRAIVTLLIIAITVMVVACVQSEDSRESQIAMTETEPVKVEQVHTHQFKSVPSSPTCQKGGYITHSCDCGYVYVDSYVAATGHKFKVTIIEPTYTDRGYTNKYCEICGVNQIDDIVEPLTHEHYYVENVVNATCWSVGYTEKKCECGDVSKYNYTNKLIHKYSDFANDNNATCLSNGTKSKKCVYCGDKISEEIPDSALGHNITGPFDHGTNHIFQCDRKDCRYQVSELHAKDSEKIVAATCTENEYVIEYCKCGAKIHTRTSNAALGHSYVITTIEPTYTSGGYDEHVCCRCNHTYQDNQTPKVPHECKYIETIVKPTCDKEGYIAGICSICSNEVITSTIEKLGHDYAEQTVEATCTEGGGLVFICSRCEDSYKQEKTPPLEHQYKTTSVMATTGWPGYDLHKCTVCGYSYKDNEVDKLSSNQWPKGYSDGSATIIIYKEWYQNAYVYAAHITFSDYSRLRTDCANGSYNNGYETTSQAARRLGAIFAVNGCYSAPYLDYTVVRSGKIWNGANRSCWLPAVYSSHNGLLLNAWETGGAKGIAGQNVQTLVDNGLVTDSFCFGPPGLSNGQLIGGSDGSRAQRTFIGTNGNAGDIWICVSDGRYNDGESAGLTYYEAMEFLQTKGCSFGVHLDGGGSSTMYFNGQVLNAAKNGQRAVVDFLVFK